MRNSRKLLNISELDEDNRGGRKERLNQPYHQLPVMVARSRGSVLMLPARALQAKTPSSPTLIGLVIAAFAAKTAFLRAPSIRRRFATDQLTVLYLCVADADRKAD
jgi:hypothetical protein